jgi:metal-responsive CopG/Arc/MetJ family transcriptional regulator
MHLKKRTYSIDERTLKAFESLVESGNRSIIISQLMRNYLNEQARKKIREAIIAGAPLVKEEYRKESEAWYPLEEEVYEKFIQSSARRHSSHRVRSSEGTRAIRRPPRTRSLS